MARTILKTAATAALLAALSAFAASPALGVVLVDQRAPAGANQIPSDDFGAGQDALDATAADDFTIPAGQSWRIESVDLVGAGSMGLAPQVSLFVWRDSKGLPGGIVFKRLNVTGTNYPNYSIALPSPQTTRSGTYWLTAQQLGATFMVPSWAWSTSTVQQGSPAVFQNPGDGFGVGCQTWKPINTCFAIPDSSMAFAVNGTATSIRPHLVKLSRNLRKGFARLTASTKGPGTLTVSGRGLVNRTFPVDGGKVTFRVNPKKKVKRRLAKRHFFQTRANLTYQSGTATPASRSVAVILLKGRGAD